MFKMAGLVKLLCSSYHETLYAELKRMLTTLSLETSLLSDQAVWQICGTSEYNRANNGKGAKFGTNEADII